MSDAIQIQISSNAQEIVRRLDHFPAVMAQAIGETMDNQNQITIGHIARARMKGNNHVPFPLEEHILGVRTARLRGSLAAAPARVFERAVESSIGSNVVYAAVHEFGSTKRNIPARQPIYYGVLDKAEDYGHAISEAIVRSWMGDKN